MHLGSTQHGNVWSWETVNAHENQDLFSWHWELCSSLSSVLHLSWSTFCTCLYLRRRVKTLRVLHLPSWYIRCLSHQQQNALDLLKVHVIASIYCQTLLWYTLLLFLNSNTTLKSWLSLQDMQWRKCRVRHLKAEKKFRNLRPACKSDWGT